MADEQDTPEVANIRSTVENWLDRINNKIEYDLLNNPIYFNRHSGSLFTGNGDQLAITLGFTDENINEQTSLEQLRSKFNFIALDRLPLPGLSGLPSNWKVHPQTPVSSFSEGVTFESFDPQTKILKIDVKTKFFAIYGSIPVDRPPMGCGRLEAGTYFQVRRNIECYLKFNAKLAF